MVDVAPDPGEPNGVILTFPSLAGRSYIIQRSHGLITWEDLTALPGDGTTIDIPVAGDPLQDTNFFRVTVTNP